MMTTDRDHVPAKLAVRHTSPFNSKSRAVLDFHAKHGLNREKILQYSINDNKWVEKNYPGMNYFVENDHVPPVYLQKHDFSLRDLDEDVMVYFDQGSALQGLVSAFIEHDRDLGNDAAPEVQNIISSIDRTSFDRSSAFKRLAKEFDIKIPAEKLVPNSGKGGGTCIPLDQKNSCMCHKKATGFVISKNSTYMDSIPKCLEKMKNLKSVSISSSLDRINNLDGLSKLEILDLRGNKIGIIENVDELISLKNFTLISNHIQKIENLETLKKLDVLSLDYNDIRRLDSFNELLDMSSLRRLVIKSNPITKEGDPIKMFEKFEESFLKKMREKGKNFKIL